MSKRSLFWTAVGLASMLSACRGGTSTIPTAGLAPVSDAAEGDDASSGRKAITITVIAPLPAKADGFSGSVFPQGARTGAIAAFTMNVGPKGKCVESKTGERFCRKKIHVPDGGPYDLVVALHRKFPVGAHAPALAAASVAFKVKGKRAQEISFATDGALAESKVALSETSIHSFDPASFVATVSGLDRFGDVLVVKSFVDSGGRPKEVVLASTLPRHVLTLKPHAFKGSSADDASVEYLPAAAAASVITGGAKVEVTAKIKNSPNAKAGKTKLTILKPKVTNARIPTSGAQPGSIALGPDGALWFCEYGAAKVGRITTEMQITAEYAGFPHPQSIASAGGALWVAQNDGAGSIDRISTSGTITPYPLPVNTYPNGISAGPSGQLWFGSIQNNYVNTISTSGVYGTQHPLATANSYPVFSTLGSDGNQYFTLNGTGQVLKVAQSGVTVGLYNEPGTNRSPENIIAGPDGLLWFSDTNQSVIYSMTGGGVFKAFPIAKTLGIGGPLAFGPDGKLWFAALNGVGRLNVTNGTTTAFTLVTGGGGFGIALAPDGAFYVTQFLTGQISRLQ